MMNKATVLPILYLIGLPCPVLSSETAAEIPHSSIPRVIVQDDNSELSFVSYLDALEETGLRVSHIIPQWRAVAGNWGQDELDRAIERVGGRLFSGDRIEPDGDPLITSFVSQWATHQHWAENTSPGDVEIFRAPHILPRPEPAELILPPHRFLSNRPYGASILDVSEFFLGDIAVSVIFPSSDGSVDPSTEDWTPDELSAQVAGIIAGMDFWIETFPGSVRFFYRFEMEVPTGYEPINHPSNDDILWIGDVLGNLGYLWSNPFRSAYFYVDDLIKDLGTDWGAIYFCVDASNDPDGSFSDGLYDYTYFGGPLLVTTSTHGGDGEEDTPTYAAHEFAHLFYANDEYLWAFEHCTVRSGYLGSENQNSDFWNCDLSEDCIMKNGYLPWTRSCIVTGTQLGILDSDSDGIPDILDTEPEVRMPGDTLRTFQVGDTINLKGKAIVQPITNLNPFGLGREITTNTITTVNWQLDNGDTGIADPLDGIYDTGSELFGVDLTGLGAGTYRLEVQAMNSVGNSSPPEIIRIIIN